MPAQDILIKNLCILLGQVLGLGDRATVLTADTALLGSLPELDSMAVATVLTAIEERFNVIIDDSNISADIFENIGTLADFIASNQRAEDVAA